MGPQPFLPLPTSEHRHQPQSFPRFWLHGRTHCALLWDWKQWGALPGCAPAEGQCMSCCALPFCGLNLSLLGDMVSGPQLLSAEEWRSNWCHPSSSPRRWVTLVTGLSVPSSCCFSYPQCKAEELIPLWGRCEGGWCGRTRV